MPSEAPTNQRDPNADTLEAMQELRAGGGKTFSSVADLMADLIADDQLDPQPSR